MYAKIFILKFGVKYEKYVRLVLYGNDKFKSCVDSYKNKKINIFLRISNIFTHEKDLRFCGFCVVERLAA